MAQSFIPELRSGGWRGHQKTRYLDVRWQAVSGNVRHTSLRDLLTEGVCLLREGALRHGAERDVPLAIWRSPAFAVWYGATSRVLRSFLLRYALPLDKCHRASLILGFLTDATVARTKEDGGRFCSPNVMLSNRNSTSILGALASWFPLHGAPPVIRL